MIHVLITTTEERDPIAVVTAKIISVQSKDFMKKFKRAIREHFCIKHISSSPTESDWIDVTNMKTVTACVVGVDENGERGTYEIRMSLVTVY